MLFFFFIIVNSHKQNIAGIFCKTVILFLFDLLNSGVSVLFLHRTSENVHTEPLPHLL